MALLRIGILRGGPSNEYDVSLKTGGAVLQHLNRERYEPVDILIDKSGAWHHRGLPVSPETALSRVDVAFNALHGSYGEDGKVQRILEEVGIPYTGADSASAELSMHKARAKEHLSSFDITMPRHRLLSPSDTLERDLLEVFRSFPHPIVVKPAASGSSVGVAVVHGYHDLVDAVEAAFEHCEDVLVEEYIRGREATCGILEQFRDEEHYAMLPIEIVPPSGKSFFDYEAKYGEGTREECPGNFSHDEKQELARLAREAHKALGLRHYSRSDFIVSPRGIYFLETNALPGLTEYSLVPKALAACGLSFPAFLDHLISLARQ